MRIITVNHDESILLKVMLNGSHVGTLIQHIPSLEIGFEFGKGTKITLETSLYEGSTAIFDELKETERGKEITEKIRELQIAIEKFKQDYSK